MTKSELRPEIDELYTAYVACLDDGELAQWPDFFTDPCLYQIVPRENYERGLPLALMRCESVGMLQDRVDAVKQTNVFAPRVLRHLLSAVRIIGIENGDITVHASFAVLETTLDEPTRLFGAGRYVDRVVRDDGQLKFREKICVLDSNLVRGSLIYPL